MIKSIQVYGPGCANCQKLHQIAQEAVKELGLEIPVEKVEDFDAMLQAGIMRTPGLGFDGKVVVQGKIPTPATVRNWIAEAMKE
ncbi:MAG: thioredoxin family protein [Calditrichia bacterium]